MIDKVKNWFAADQKRVIIGAVIILATAYWLIKKAMNTAKFKKLSKAS